MNTLVDIRASQKVWWEYLPRRTALYFSIKIVIKKVPKIMQIIIKIEIALL